MFERTTLCLDSGCLRRLLPTFKNSLQKQSKYHYSIQKHRRIILELVPIVAVLAQEQLSQGSCCSTRSLYDFLHQTLFLGQNLKIWGSCRERSDRLHTRSWLRKISHRNYSSKTTPSLSSGIQEDSELSKIFEDAVAELKEKLNLPDKLDPERVWKRYENFDFSEKNSLRKPLLYYLQNSDRKVDHQRVTQLFESLGLSEKDATVCQHVIQSYLKLNDHRSALEVYGFATRRLKFPSGCKDILRYLIKANKWSQAFKLWKNEPSLAHELNYHRLIGEESPEIPTALSLTSWVNIASGQAEREQASSMKKFALIIVEEVLRSTYLGNETSYLNLIKSISGWTSISGDFYSNLFVFLAKNQKRARLLNSYRTARLNKNFSISKSALLAVLQEFCHLHDVLGMKEVLDDFFSMHSRPSRAAYRMCLKEFARQGDAETVHALFKQYVGRYKKNTQETFAKSRSDVRMRRMQDESGRSDYFEDIDEAAPLTSNDFAPLLYVHARRGESKVVEKLFDQIQDVYKVRLDTLCWNIRLSVYVKIHDTEKAFSCFEEIFNNPSLQPDHYTIGTMMAISARKADLNHARGLLELATELNIPHSNTMLNFLVTCLIRNNKFAEAEEICLSSLKQNLPGPKISMWNSLVIGYALNRNLTNVNRIFKVMAENSLEYDQYTYSALMQALVMTRQPNIALKLLTQVMPEAEIKPTSFNYAVLLGGFLATQEWNMFDLVHQRLLESRIKQGISTKFMTLRAAATQDRIMYNESTNEDRFKRSLQIFAETMGSIDPQDLSETARKTGYQMPIDILYPALFYSFVAYILNQYGESKAASELLSHYKSLIPEEREKAGETLKILTAVMSLKFSLRDYDGVKQYWEKAVSFVKEEASPLPPISKITSQDDTSKTDEVPYFHQLRLNDPLKIYMKSLVAQKKMIELNMTIEDLVSYGFELDIRNWNEYVKILARSSKYHKLAFKICEYKLMPGWQGWRIQRHKLAGHRHKIPLFIRRLKLNSNSLRPYYDTIMWLTRRMIDLEARASESPLVQKQINLLKHEYPLTIKAIEEIPRTNSDDESILMSDKSQFEL